MIRRLQTFLLTLLVSLASTLSYADEISATLEHTAGTGWSSAASNTPTVDSEQEYYNLDTNTGWAGIAFAKFSFAIPDGQTITSATLTWACKQYNGSQYASTIYYLNEGVNVDFDNFASMDPLSNYRMAGQKTWIEDHEKLQGAKTTGKLLGFTGGLFKVRGRSAQVLAEVLYSHEGLVVGVAEVRRGAERGAEVEYAPDDAPGVKVLGHRHGQRGAARRGRTA